MPETPSVRIRLLGALAIDDEPVQLARRDRIVLSRLATSAGRVVARDTLIDALWDGDTPASADKVVQGTIMRLRRLLGPDAIETAPGGYRLALPAAEVDVLQFKAMAGRSRELAVVGGADRAAHLAGQALALWSSDRVGVTDGDALEPDERLALLDMRRTVEEEHLDLLLSLRGGGDLVERGAELIEIDPHREQRWALLARAQYRVGRQADALRTIQRAQHMLRAELGLELSPLLTELERRILQQDPLLEGDRCDLDARDDVGEDDVCPYRGLLAFDVEDRDVFYGRERAVADALTRLAQTGSLVMVGPSGSGKSSVLRAGVVTTLRAEGRQAVIVELGTTAPKVADELAGLSRETVVVIDQFEELFTESRASVADEELAALSRWRGSLAIALRSDHLDRLNAFPWLTELAERSLLLLRPPELDDLRSAIVGPAAASGLRLEPGLVELMLRDAAGEPGALPLMSHALRATWLRREGRTLTVDGYERAGGLSGAIAATADDVYEHLDDDERSYLRRLMVRLFDVSEGSRPTRSRVAIETAFGQPGGRLLVDRLSAARLVVTDDEGVTVAHEALATAWPRLAEWLDLDRATARRHRHLSDAASTWNEMGQPTEELYRGARLADAVEWRQRASPSLTAVESSFLDASATHAAADRVRMQAELSARSRTNRRLRGMFAIAVAMLLLLVAVSAATVKQSRNADAARFRAELAGSETARQALLASATSLLDSDRALALLLLAEADRIDSDVGSRSALLAAFVDTAGFVGNQYLDGPSPLLDVVAAGDDELFAVDNRLSGWRVGIGEEPSAPVRLADPLGTGSALVAHDPTSGLVAIYRDPTDDTARLDVYDADTLRPVIELPVADKLTSLAISPGGEYVAVGGGESGTVDVARVDQDRVIASLAVPAVTSQTPPRSAALTIGADDVLYIATPDRAVRRYQLPELTPLEAFEPSATFPTTAGLRLIDDGATLIGHGWADGPATHSVVSRWDVATGATAWQSSTRLPCQELAILADEGTLACTSSFGLVEFLSVHSGESVGTVDTQQSRVSAIAALPDGRRYITASATEAALGVWDTAGGGPITVVDSASSRHNTPLYYSPNGEHVVAVAVPFSPFDVGSDRACDFPVSGGCLLAPDLVDGDTGAVVDSLDGVLGAAWFGDSLLFVAADGTIRVTDLATGDAEVIDSSAVSSLGEIVDYDAVRRRLFLWADDGTSYLLDAASRRFERSAIPTTPVPRSAAFSGNGELIAMVSDGELSLVDLDTGELVAGPLRGFESVDARADLVVAGDRAGRIHVLDASTLKSLGPPIASGSGAVQEIEIADGGDVVMARSGDAVRLFDLASSTQLGTAIPVPRADALEGAAFRPDGKRLAVAADAGLAIWNLDPSDWGAAACRLAGRNLTREEWNVYIGDLAPYHATCDDRD